MSDRAKNAIISWIIAFVFTCVYFLLITFVRRDWSLMGWYNNFFVTGVLVLLTGGLQTVYWFGAFDMFQYGFMQLFHYMRREPGEMKHKDFAEYRLYRAEKRKKLPLYPWAWIAFGATFMLCSLIFRLQIS